MGRLSEFSMTLLLFGSKPLKQRKWIRLDLLFVFVSLYFDEDELRTRYSWWAVMSELRLEANL